MPKNICYAVAIILLMQVTGGCKKFIELNPISQANVNDFYKTAQDIDNAVIAAYKFHKQIFSTNFCSQHRFDELRSDNTGLPGLTDPLDHFTKDIGTEWYMWSWDKSYKAIYTANLVIEKAVGPEMAEELRNRYIAEVRFLRAITYFELVRNFGDVPLIIETPKSLDKESVNVIRDPVPEVYEQIIDDLEFAEANLPVSYSGNEIGRATKGAAVGFLGKVQLTRGDKVAAEASFRKVMTYGYELLPDYASVFAPNEGNSKESIFELQFKADNDPSPFPQIFASMKIPADAGFGYNQPTQDLFDAYEAGDPRRDLTMAIDLDNRYYLIKYSDFGASPYTNANNNIPLMRYPEILLLLAESLGETTEAYDLINMVRNRVGLDDIDANTPGTFEEKLLRERRVEFAGENLRWHDLLRFGVAIEVMNAFFVKEHQGLITIGQDDLLFPIPNFARLTNPNLAQNPGYPN